MNVKIACLVLTLDLLACGKKSSDDSASSATTALEGVWKTSCITITYQDDTKSYYQVVVTYSGNTFKKDVVSYGSDNCSISRYSYTYKGTFTIGEQYNPISGAYKLDNKYSSISLRYSQAEYVENANEKAIYEYTDWVINTDKEIAGKKASSSDTAEPSIGDFDYDIFKIDGKTLKLGDSDTGDGTSLDKRPTALDESIVATKQ